VSNFPYVIWHGILTEFLSKNKNHQFLHQVAPSVVGHYLNQAQLEFASCWPLSSNACGLRHYLTHFSLKHNKLISGVQSALK
jgi:hypothetical protein